MAGKHKSKGKNIQLLENYSVNAQQDRRAYHKQGIYIQSLKKDQESGKGSPFVAHAAMNFPGAM